MKQMKHIIEKINEAIASVKKLEENKKLLSEIKEELTNAKTELKILEIIACLIKIISDFF